MLIPKRSGLLITNESKPKNRMQSSPTLDITCGQANTFLPDGLYFRDIGREIRDVPTTCVSSYVTCWYLPDPLCAARYCCLPNFGQLAFSSRMSAFRNTPGIFCFERREFLSSLLTGVFGRVNLSRCPSLTPGCTPVVAPINTGDTTIMWNLSLALRYLYLQQAASYKIDCSYINAIMCYT